MEREEHLTTIVSIGIVVAVLILGISLLSDEYGDQISSSPDTLSFSSITSAVERQIIDTNFKIETNNG